MSKNSRQIDYRLRLGKYVERRMLCTAFQKLSLFYPLHSYKYIGFGAYYFSDFYLFHKELGITNMLSVEHSMAKETQIRYNFNKPFQCIDIDFRDSSDVLPELEWEEPAIVWLDYTSALTAKVLSDIDTVVRGAQSGSIVVISLNLDPESYNIDNEETKDKITNFREIVGPNYIPRDVTLKDLTPKFLHLTYTNIIKRAITNVLFERNSIEKEDGMKWFQLFNFKYTDGAPMYTIGGILVQGADHLKKLEHIEFNELNFIRQDETQFEITIPNLTVKEIKFLESIMPGGINPDGTLKTNQSILHEDPKIPSKDILNFSKIYKYFPTFTESRIG